MNLQEHKNNIDRDGFTIINHVFESGYTDKLINLVEKSSPGSSNFRRSTDLFAIRNFIGEVPEAAEFCWTSELNLIIDEIFGEAYFNVKSIYFDKPALSNWLVSWHQDTTISVNRKEDIHGFTNWTLKQGLQAVQPSLPFLENLFTIRIHLDDCDESNGVLKVIPGSHKLGILKDSEIQQLEKSPVHCPVKKGGIMIMKPLLLHSSSRSTGSTNRRVVHLEFSSLPLPGNLDWRERSDRKMIVL